MFEILIPTMDVVKLSGDIPKGRQAHEWFASFLGEIIRLIVVQAKHKDQVLLDFPVPS